MRENRERKVSVERQEEEQKANKCSSGHQRPRCALTLQRDMKVKASAAGKEVPTTSPRERTPQPSPALGVRG